MSSKRIGRPPTGPTKTKVSLTIDTEMLDAAKLEIPSKWRNLSTLIEHALDIYIKSREAAEFLPPNIVSLPARAHILAAAGSPITAEVTDWDGADDTVQVKIAGLSMSPKLSDGEVVTMRHKRAARNPFMKKGLIYLVEYDGGFTVKRYNTRKAKPDENGEEWVENGKVKVLESINPEFPEIVIKQDLAWIAWLDERA